MTAMAQAAIWIEPDMCGGCGLCIQACGRKLIALDDHGLARVLEPQRCAQCGHCKAVCPSDAPLRLALGLPQGHQVPICFTLGYPELQYQRLVARRPARVNWL
jgi:ferredoxin